MDKKELVEKARYLNELSNEEIFGFDDLENPIIEEIEDSTQLQKFFEQRKLIPYAGSILHTGHSLLNYYDSIALLSSTSFGILQSQKSTAFSGNPIIKKSDNNIFEEKQIIEDKGILKDISEVVNEIIFDRGNTILDFPHNAYEGVFKNGNAYIEIVLSEVLGKKVAGLFIHRQRNVLYDSEPKEFDKLLAISPIWEEDYLKKYPPTKLPLYPEVKEFKDGTIRTMIHIKQGGKKYYGRPRNEGCFFELYREFQNNDYLVKQAANEFSGKLIIEVEQADPKTHRLIDNQRDRKAGFEGTADRWAHNFTMKKSAKGFVLIERPASAGAFKAHQLRPMTNENFYKITGEIAKKSIISANGWSRWLIGDSESSGLSSNMLSDAYSFVDKTIVPTIQSKILEAQNKALHIIYDWLGRSDLKQYYFNYKLKSDDNDIIE